MKSTRKFKNLAIAAVMGLVIAVQSVMPVMAAEVCGKCGGTITETTEIKSWDESETCPLTEHASAGCVLITTFHDVTITYSCPEGCYFRAVTHPTTERRHVSVARYAAD